MVAQFIGVCMLIIWVVNERGRQEFAIPGAKRQKRKHRGIIGGLQAGEYEGRLRGGA